MNFCTTSEHLSKRVSVLMCWYIWNQRNISLFEDKNPSVWVTVYKVLGDLNIISLANNPLKLRKNPIWKLSGYSLTFFDGVSINGGSNCGVG